MIVKANKNYYSNLVYFAEFETRFKRQLFLNSEEDNLNKELFKKSIEGYLEKNDITILNYDFCEDGYTVRLEISAPPTLSPTEIVFNIKKYSVQKLLKPNKERLSGEHAIWTRQYLVSDTKENLEQLKNIREGK